jgi:hypothetical protein
VLNWASYDSSDRQKTQSVGKELFEVVLFEKWIWALNQKGLRVLVKKFVLCSENPPDKNHQLGLVGGRSVSGGLPLTVLWSAMHPIPEQNFFWQLGHRSSWVAI